MKKQKIQKAIRINDGDSLDEINKELANGWFVAKQKHIITNRMYVGRVMVSKGYVDYILEKTIEETTK